MSPTYEREYREWLADGRFDELIARDRRYLSESFEEQIPALIAQNLQTYATCYYTRGAVRLLDGDRLGWHDIQCGYWAALFSLRFQIKAVTLPAWSAGRTLGPREKAEIVLTSGFARLFQQQADAEWLASQIEQHVQLDELVGRKSQAGRLILDAIMGAGAPATYEALLADRKKSCQARDAWPTRPTEIVPFGVVDVEAVLCFPDKCRFPYRDMEFLPTADGDVEQAIVNYYTWDGSG